MDRIVPVILEPAEQAEAIPYLRSFMEHPTVDNSPQATAARLSTYQSRRQRAARRRALALLAFSAAILAGAAYAIAAMGPTL